MSRNVKFSSLYQKDDQRYHHIKWAVSPCDELDLPHLSRLRREKITAIHRGKEITHQLDKMN